MSDTRKAVLLAIFGIAEGFAFAKVGIASPQVFRDGMEFKSFMLMKLFISAVGFSMLGQSLFSLIDKAGFEKSRSYSRNEVGWKRATLGCFTMGFGMYIAGSGPTMIPTQIFSGVQTGPLIFAGAMFGGALFGLVEKVLIKKPVAMCTIADSSLDGLTGLPYAVVAVPMALALLGATVILERFSPHPSELARIGALSIPNAWLPIFAGAAVGLNQIPIRLLSGKGQGGSTSIMQFISTLSGGLIQPRSKITKIADTFQIAYVYVGTSLGALAAVAVANGAYRAAPGFGHVATFVGAAIMLFGARFANGCTCGHGITGMSELSLTSIAAAMSIFGGGITAGLMHHFVGL